MRACPPSFPGRCAPALPPSAADARLPSLLPRSVRTECAGVPNAGLAGPPPAEAAPPASTRLSLGGGEISCNEIPPCAHTNPRLAPPSRVCGQAPAPLGPLPSTAGARAAAVQLTRSLSVRTIRALDAAAAAAEHASIDRWSDEQAHAFDEVTRLAAIDPPAPHHHHQMRAPQMRAPRAP